MMGSKFNGPFLKGSNATVSEPFWLSPTSPPGDSVKEQWSIDPPFLLYKRRSSATYVDLYMQFDGDHNVRKDISDISEIQSALHNRAWSIGYAIYPWQTEKISGNKYQNMLHYFRLTIPKWSLEESSIQEMSMISTWKFKMEVGSVVEANHDDLRVFRGIWT